MENVTGIRVVRTLEELRRGTAEWRKNNESIALVPTMGALHSGHMALVEAATGAARRTVVSIFVNPAQFAPHEDLDRYPRDEAADLKRLDEHSVDLVWAPSVAEMYPDGFSTYVMPGSASQGLETDFRPHFFQGVATVVLKLFNQVAPDLTFFGEKDYQQLAVVKQVARDLNLTVEVKGVPTAREKDGLALSSRNVYLSPREREIAPELYRVISDVAANAHSGDLSALAAEATDKLTAAGFDKVDYVEIRDAETLSVFAAGSGRSGRVLAAAWLGRTRLIDNVGILG